MKYTLGFKSYVLTLRIYFKTVRCDIGPMQGATPEWHVVHEYDVFLDGTLNHPYSIC